MSKEKHNQERKNLHKHLWDTANSLRGTVESWDFKQYVLGFLFYRFISEAITDYINKWQHESGDLDFNYENITDQKAENIRKKSYSKKVFLFLQVTFLLMLLKMNWTT